MKQYICFYDDYLNFVGGVKYKINDTSGKYYVVAMCVVPKGRSDLYKIGEISI